MIEINTFIKQHLFNSKNKLNSKKMNKEWFLKNGFENQYNEIMNFICQANNLTDKINTILFGFSFCKECGKEIKHNKIYCSLKCSNHSLCRAEAIKMTWKKPQTKIKQRQTFINNNGFYSNFHRSDVQQKIKNHNHCNEIKNSMVKKYGVSSNFQIPYVQQKIRKTYLEKYGCHPSQTHIPKELLTQEWWNSQSSFLEVKEQIGSSLSLSNKYLYAHKFRPDWKFDGIISQPHQRIINFLNEHGIPHEVNDRQQIKPLELDIWIPLYSLAIEINGVYWHSEEKGKGETYHLNKTNLCLNKGIILFHFTDIEIEQEWNKVKLTILDIINNT